MVFDSNRQTLILIGADWIYEFDGEHWRKNHIPFDTTENYIHDYSIVYDDNIKKTLLFGGFDIHPVVIDGDFSHNEYYYYDKTRLWDGNGWELLPVNGPSARAGSAIGYDPKRKVVVLFGGFTGGDNEEKKLADTWEFDGSAWHLMKFSGPPPSVKGLLIYNPYSERMMLVRRLEYDRFIRSIWEWDGRQWYHVGSVPDDICGIHLLVTSDYKNKQVLFFSCSERAPSREIWRMNADYSFQRLWFEENTLVNVFHHIISDPNTGIHYAHGEKIYSNGWTTKLWQLDPAKYSPPEQKLWRKLHTPSEGPGGKCTLVYDKKNEAIVAFNGRNTWTLEGGDWIDHGATGPGRWGTGPIHRLKEIEGRDDYAMVYHAGLEGVLIVGGRGKGGFAHDEWLWNGKRWRLLESAPGFANRLSHLKSVYDSRKDHMIVQGNYYVNGYNIETWIRTNNEWTQLEGSNYSPRADDHEWSNMVYDSNKDKTYFFKYYYWFWELYGRRWRMREYQNPSQCVGMDATIIYHPGLKMILLIGGYEEYILEPHLNLRFYDEVRFWNGKYWEILPSATLPTPRKLAGAAYNEKTGELILAGGIGPNGKPLHDTWRMKLPRKYK